MEEQTNYKKAEPKSQGKSKKISVFHILSGGILTEEFVVRQSKLLILIVFLIVIFISNRYSCMKKLTEIEDLTRQLNDIKYENLIISTELTTNSRQSQIEALLQEKGIKLEGSKSPAYIIHK